MCAKDGNVDDEVAPRIQARCINWMKTSRGLCDRRIKAKVRKKNNDVWYWLRHGQCEENTGEKA